MGNLKDFILRDVKDENESNRPAVTIRLMTAVLVVYGVFLAFSMVWSPNAGILRMACLDIVVSGMVFGMTYVERVRQAAVWMNIWVIAWMFLGVYNIGWDAGAQQFVFVMLLVDFFLPYWKLSNKLFYVAVMCAVRIFLYFWCKQHVPIIRVPLDEIYYIQVITIICVFALVSLSGCLISSNFVFMEQKLMETNKKLRHLAETDPLTGLKNRMCIMDYAERAFKKGSEVGMSVAIGDIDFFKHINDTYGHDGGDVVLKTLSELFRSFMKQYGAVARWGGEEFLFFFGDSNGDQAYAALMELRDRIKRQEVVYDGQKIHISMTFGLIEIDRNKPLDENILEADHRLYHGKEHGRDQVVY